MFDRIMPEDCYNTEKPESCNHGSTLQYLMDGHESPSFCVYCGKRINKEVTNKENKEKDK